MNKELKINENRVFFVGIGGVSMSALAKLCYSFGAVVAGSDLVKTTETEKLEPQIKVFYGHNKTNLIKFKPTIVVFTGAVNKDNPEIKYAISKGIKVFDRAEFLGLICEQYKTVIAVSGTHGKTTTTGMIAEIFIKAKLNPTVHIGGEVVNLNGNLVVGDNNFFITEACEFKKSFEQIKSTVAVITNIECDHMDCYKNFNDLCLSFFKFSNKAKTVVMFNNCPIKRDFCKNKNIINLKKYKVKNIKIKKGKTTFKVWEYGKFLGLFELSVMGKYNVYNAVQSIAVARIFNIPYKTIYLALKNFKGVKRRNEILGKINGVPVFADYCHHPTEIKNSIKAFKGQFNRVLCVFQPHTYSRTKSLLRQFKRCFKGVEKLIIYKTYSARENYDFYGSETILYGAVVNSNRVLCLEKVELIKKITEEIDNYDAVIVLGAGDIYGIVKNGLTFN